jgi:hypothetical protein
MGTKLNPGAWDCHASALLDEPMFTLLARDPNAPAVVRRWAHGRALYVSLGRAPESDRAMVEEAHRGARDMELWRKANDGRWRTEKAPADVKADLLAALKIAKEELEAMGLSEEYPAICIIRAAIAKAEPPS